MTPARNPSDSIDKAMYSEQLGSYTHMIVVCSRSRGEIVRWYQRTSCSAALAAKGWREERPFFSERTVT